MPELTVLQVNQNECASTLLDVIMFGYNMLIVITKHDTHLGTFISYDIYDRNIDNTVWFLSKKSWINK